MLKIWLLFQPRQLFQVERNAKLKASRQSSTSEWYFFYLPSHDSWIWPIKLGGGGGGGGKQHTLEKKDFFSYFIRSS